MLESRNLDHMKANCLWDMFLWKNSGVDHSFMSFSKLFQFCNYARSTKCGSREKYLFVRHVFVKRSKQISQFNSFTSISKLFQLCSQARIKEFGSHWSNCSWDMFLKANSGGLHIFISFTNIFQLCTNARITKYGTREKYLFLWKDSGVLHSFTSFLKIF